MCWDVPRKSSDTSGSCLRQMKIKSLKEQQALEIEMINDWGVFNEPIPGSHIPWDAAARNKFV